MQKVNQALKIVLQISKRKTDKKTKKINQLDYFKMIIQLDLLPQVLSIFFACFNFCSRTTADYMYICIHEYKQMTAAEQMKSDALYSRQCNRLITKDKIFHVSVF